MRELTEPVWGEGPVPAEFMIIGEAPGRTEARTGRPFVGPSGVRLTALLRSIGLDRGRVYITNRIKVFARPTVKLCRAWDSVLADELERVRPRIVIALGTWASRFFIPDVRLARDHGVPVEVGGRLVIPMYHPAATLRNPNLWPVLVDDFRKVPTARPVEPPSGEYRIGTPLDAVEYSSAHPVLALDFETDSPIRGGVFSPTEARPIGFSLSGAEGQGVYVPFPGVVGAVVPNHRIIAHNAKFESTMLSVLGVEPPVMDDTKIMAWLLGYPDTGLKTLVQQILGRRPVRYEEVAVDGSLVGLDPKSVVEYAAADADHTYRLYRVLREQLESWGLVELYERVERPLTNILARMEIRGVKVARERLESARSMFESLERAEESAAHDCGVPDSVNIGSGDQLSAWLESMNAPIRSRTEVKGTLRTDSLTLESIADWHPAIPHILRFRMFRKLRGFAESWARFLHPDSTLHPQFNQAGRAGVEEDEGDGAAPPGRLSCSSPNLQQIPHHGRGRGAEYEQYGTVLRRCIVARPGYRFVVADIGQQEPRVTAVVAPEPTMLLDFERGVPIYAPMGRAIYGYDIGKSTHPTEWHTAKTFFLALVYGAGPDKLVEIDPRLGRDAARRGYKALVERYKGLVGFSNRVRMDVSEQGFVRDWFGRVRWFPAILAPERSVREAAIREACNFTIQAPAASVSKIIMQRAVERLSGVDAHLVLVVHDELVIEAHESVVGTVMDVLATIGNDIMPIPFPLEISVGSSYGELERVL